ncbi:MAG: hypothetical protein WC928_00910 [Patescibacteria group bacterium]|jgi:hypothetical protein
MDQIKKVLYFGTMLLGLLSIAHSQEISKKQAKEIWEELLGKDFSFPKITDSQIKNKKKDSCLINLPIFGIGKEILKVWQIENIENIKIEDFEKPVTKNFSINLCQFGEFLATPEQESLIKYKELISPPFRTATFLEMVEIITLLKLMNYDFWGVDNGQEIIIWTDINNFNYAGPRNVPLATAYVFCFYPQKKNGFIGSLAITLLPMENLYPMAIGDKYISWSFKSDRTKNEYEDEKPIESFVQKISQEAIFFEKLRTYRVIPLPISP